MKTGIVCEADSSRVGGYELNVNLHDLLHVWGSIAGSGELIANLNDSLSIGLEIIIVISNPSTPQAMAWPPGPQCSKAIKIAFLLDAGNRLNYTVSQWIWKRLHES